MKHKKILLGSMSTVMAVAAPVATVVACGNAKKAEQTKMINVNVNVKSALDYAKKEATVYNNQSTTVQRKDPFGYLIGNVVEQLLDQIGNKVPSIKNISTKLKTKNKKGETFYQVIGKEAKEILFNKKSLTMDDTDPTANLSLKSLATILLDPATYAGLPNGIGLQGVLKMFKAIESGTNPFTQKPFADANEKAATLKKITTIFALNGYGNFVLLGMGVYTGPTLITMVSSALDVLGNVFAAAGIKTSDFINIIKEINNSMISIDINIFGEHMKFNTPKIKIASDMKEKLEKTLIGANPTVQAVFQQLKNEINKELKKMDQSKTLSEALINGSNSTSTGGSKTSTTGGSKTTSTGSSKTTPTGGGDPIQNILNKVPQLFTSGALGSLIDLMTFIIDIADNKKITNQFAFENQKNIDIFKDIAKQFAPDKEKTVEAIFTLFKELVGLYR